MEQALRGMGGAAECLVFLEGLVALPRDLAITSQLLYIGCNIANGEESHRMLLIQCKSLLWFLRHSLVGARPAAAPSNRRHHPRGCSQHTHPKPLTIRPPPHFIFKKGMEEKPAQVVPALLWLRNLLHGDKAGNVYRMERLKDSGFIPPLQELKKYAHAEVKVSLSTQEDGAQWADDATPRSRLTPGCASTQSCAQSLLIRISSLERLASTMDVDEDEDTE